MTSFLITFKPASENSERGMPIQLLRAMARRLQSEGTVKENWRFFTRAGVAVGDRAFLLLQGRSGPAIVGHGRIARLPRKVSGTWSAHIRFENVVDPSAQAIVKNRDLYAIRGSEKHWKTQFSGRRIPDDVAIALELLILGGTATPVRSREDLLRAVNALPAKSHCLRYSYKMVWQKWLSEYPSANSARIIYNRVEKPEMLLWLAAAAGMNTEIILEAAKIARSGVVHSSQTKAAAVRRLLPWARVAAQLATRSKNGGLGGVLEDHALAQDLEAIYRSAQKKTTIAALVDARLGQGWFRESLGKRWNNRCAVTQWAIPSLLRASHIKPWSKSSSDERLNPANGILLAAHVDALFDRGLISFSNDGKMLVSRQIVSHLKALQLPGRLIRKPSIDEMRFLKFHREFVFSE